MRVGLPFLTSRRSFLAQAACSGAFLLGRPRLLHALAACQIKTQHSFTPGLERFISKVPAGADEFICEKYAEAIDKLLAEFSADLRLHPQDVSVLDRVIVSDVKFSSLAQVQSVPVRETGAIRVERAQFQTRETTGRVEFLNSWRAYVAPFTHIVCAEFQMTSVQTQSESPLRIATQIRYDLAGQRNSDVREERTGEWQIDWQCNSSGNWQISHWRAARETRATLTGPGFVDITSSCLGGNASYHEQMLRGIDYWRTTIDAASGIDVYGNNGVAVGDFDGDGCDDFYVCQPSGLPNRLYRNRGDGTFEDVTESSGLGLLDGTACALFADFTNSGTQDLLVVRTSGPLLFLNHGHGKFELRPDAFRFAKSPAGTFTAVAAADYNRDGLLDVYFCLYAYYQGLSQYTHPMPYYDAQNGPPNFLLRNRGDGTFEDVTESSGMNRNNNRFTFACGWCDYNNDGWPDLYVANDFGRKNFYRNNGDGTFSDIAEEAGVADYGAGMSVSWFDYDNDGRQDLYVADMWSAAGRRVTAQKHFLPAADTNVRRAYQKHANGNSLFKNANAGQFLDATAEAGVGMGRWSWSADPWDFDHDGYSDLYVTNGFISGIDRQDLSSFFWRQIVARSLQDSGSTAADYQLAWNAINELIRSDYTWSGYERNVAFLNNRDGSFADVSVLLGLDFEDDSRAFGLGDFDQDGRLEIILKNRNAPQLRILRNEINPIGDSVVFRLFGTKGNRDAIGAVVSVECRNGRQVKFLQAGSGFFSQHTKELSFGLGSSPGAIRATIRWPDGSLQSYENIPINHRVSISEGDQGFGAQPFRAARLHKTQEAPQSSPEQLPSTFETWLIDPLQAPHFALPDLNGQTRDLAEYLGKPLLLVIVGSGCEQSRNHLLRLSERANDFRSRSIELLAMDAGHSMGARAVYQTMGLSLPVLLADETVAGIYNILYRYLFDRRRNLETPLSFLIDPHGSMVKLYQGPVAPDTVLKDAAESHLSGDLLAKAFPFKGEYHGGTPRRNYFTYGVAYIQNNYADAALSCFQNVIAANPNNAAAYYNVGTIYLNKSMPAEAKASLEKAVVLDPQDADAWTNLGAIAGQQKDYDEAFRCFLQAVHIKPAHLVALQNLVLLYRWQGKLDQAQALVEKAIAAEPGDPEFHFALGMLLAGQNKFAAARKELERTVQLRPADTTALNDLGVVYLRLGREDDAFNCFQRCTKLAPDYDRPYLNLAVIYQHRQDNEKGRDILRQFLARHPDNAEVQSALQQLAR